MKSNDQLLNARKRFIDSMSQNFILYGITHSIGRLYGLLYFSEEPMTLDEMKEELGMSKTSMSTAVRQLHELNMVNKVWKKGERKDLYESSDDWHQIFTDFFSVKWRHGITQNIDTIHLSIEDLHEILKDSSVDEETKITAKNDIEKLDVALDYYNWLNRLVDSIESKEIFNHIPK